MKNMHWNDLRMFVHVARGGGLTAAADALGSSPATVGRRMLALEAAVGRPLFIRRQTGYELTVDGRTLFAKALALELARLSERFRLAIAETIEFLEQIVERKELDAYRIPVSAGFFGPRPRYGATSEAAPIRVLHQGRCTFSLRGGELLVSADPARVGQFAERLHNTAPGTALLRAA